QKWVDEYLRWDKSEHGNITFFVTKARDIWTPNVSVRNGEDKIIEHFNDTSMHEVVVTSNGIVSTNIFKETRTFCELNLVYFPFDVQTCYISLHSWPYISDQVVFRTQCSKINLEHQNPGEEWAIIETKVFKQFLTSNCTEYKIWKVNFKLSLKRNPQIYITYMLLPCFTFSLLFTFVSVMPSDSKQMINFAVTILLSYNFFQNLMYHFLAVIGEYVPYLSEFIFLFLLLKIC
ncbi:hypothetical protein HELRODRAFT_86704, partial [Helobdella robusta]|uniref:Neurotransmitter-gated ion-channel ligand-binding domain-containing protein n=1 Tax=Helobdella robusta TaxID=6412 RepID=T1G6F7_HELRO